MPRIALETTTGSESFAYTISTPTQDRAERIAQGVPTILLIHPSYTLSAIFHPMYEDPRLRRFNLVAMDLRGHGGTSAKVEDTYTTEVAAHDCLKLMDALGISEYHVAGVSMGASVALQMAIQAPQKILSLFLLSPPPLTEPADSIEGRQEIYECWKHGFENDDKEAVGDGVVGGLQMAYNNTETPFSKACVVNADSPLITLLNLTELIFGASLTAVTMDTDTRNWASNFDVMYTVTVRYLQNQKPHAAADLARIRCPVLLLHCNGDIVYTRESAEELLALLRSVHVDARLDILEGAPHYGNVTHANKANAMLYDFVLANAPEDLPESPNSPRSPFLEQFAAFGLTDDDDETDSDEE
ncbi:Alpha/beta hydrolase [Mycena sanguinolenta]|uniref:Alpha/beta hydrolase n=1 Tax=Mycena sanguinolenta TaxID=230812 RepID=A0A8H7CF85_9AGAR|nr:Alpha/beta hydrolase [Mycena sanguinolenta]